jgi:hypothetical protein
MGFWWEIQNEGEHYEDLDWTTILDWIVEEYDGVICTGYI